MWDEARLTGQTRAHVQQVDRPRFAAHPDAVRSFLAMREDAAGEGIDLRPFSAFRDRKTQLRIWRQKWNGERPIPDRNGDPIDRLTLDEDDLIEAILGWSALPGCSRHHWGSEIDVYDAAALPENGRVALVPEEARTVFVKLHGWLDENLSRFGFFRPYAVYDGGVYPEPWHLSFAAVSEPASRAHSLGLAQRTLIGLVFPGRERVLKRLPELYARFVKT